MIITITNRQNTAHPSMTSVPSVAMFILLYNDSTLIASGTELMLMLILTSTRKPAFVMLSDGAVACRTPHCPFNERAC